MITAEIKVNGVIIGHLQIANITHLSKVERKPEDGDLYECEYHRFEHDTVKFFVSHKREDGAEYLMARAFKELLKRK